MADEKVKLTPAERDAERRAKLLAEIARIDERAKRRAVEGETRKEADHRKFVLGGVLWAGVAAGAKPALAALEWAKTQVTEPRQKVALGVDLTDDERARLAASKDRQAARRRAREQQASDPDQEAGEAA